MNDIVEKIEQAVRECAKIMLTAERTPEMVENKAGRANFVTTYDKAVQEALRQKLKEIMPEAHFIGEEDDQPDSMEGCDCFIVDPIDGTTNFIRDYQTSAISVALIRAGEPYLGIIYNPYLDEMYSAEKGCGAYRNGERIHVSKETMEHAIILFGTSPYYEELSKKSFEIAYDFFKRSADVRRSGSAALDLCSIAGGRADLFFELRLSPWDYAAGAVLVTEAGGKITQMDGSKIILDKPCSILATNGIVS